MRLISERCREFENLDLASSTLQEEQERELAPEIEREREIQRRPPVAPRPHIVHPDICTFVTTGFLPESSPAFKLALQTLKVTSGD